MSTPANYRMLDHYKGNTWDGVQFTILKKVDATPIDITGTQIKIQFRKGSIKGSLTKEVTDTNGITIVDAPNGILKINPFLLDWEQGVYYYDVQITFVSAEVKTYIKGTLTVLQDTTF